MTTTMVESQPNYSEVDMKKKSIVASKKQDELDAARWRAFLTASGVPFNQLTPTWWDAFDAQSDPSTASSVLVELVDVAMTQDNLK